jgi:hypothetical protein
MRAGAGLRRARVLLRARIVLLAAEGKQDLKIARLLSIVPRNAARWRSRFLRDGIAGLEHDAPPLELSKKRILAYIEEHNRLPKPVIWTAKANDILEKVKRAKANVNDSSSGPVTWKETPFLSKRIHSAASPRNGSFLPILRVTVLRRFLLFRDLRRRGGSTL